MIIRRRFRPLGKLLQRFGRGQINNYTHTTNMASRADVPPVWESDTQEPLIWSDPDVNPDMPDAASIEAAPTPAIQRRSSVQRKSVPASASTPTPADSGQRRTPPDLWKIHELHTKMLEEEGYRMPPSPWAQPVDPATASRLPAPPSGSKASAVQRRAQSPASQADPSRPPGIPPTPAPPTISGRRRGRVIEEKTPLEMGESSASMPDDETSGWETELETGEDRPDLFEALMSEGVIQRRPDPDLSDAETFVPQFRTTPPEPLVDRESSSPASSTSDSAPAIQRSEALSQPPRPERAARTRPQTPPVFQGSSAPPPVQRQSALPDAASEFYATDDADIPPALVPAPGTTESDLLDMLGLPPDTPVRGLNPASAIQPTTDSPAQTNGPSTPAPSSAPAASVQRQSAPPDVQRAESTPPVQTPGAPANPTPRTAQRVNVPPTSPYRSQTSGEQISPEHVSDSASPSSAPTSLSNPTVMRQPEVPDPQADASEALNYDAADDTGEWSEQPAVSGFTEFFEAAENAQTVNNWPSNEPVEPSFPQWSEPEAANPQPGESLPRANPFPPSSEPAAAVSSAPTRPTARVQRAEAEPDLPYMEEDESESFSDFEDTQPVDLPFTSSSAPMPEPGSQSSVQRAAVPPDEMPGEPYPRMVDPALIEEMAQQPEIPYSWLASDEVEAQSPESPSQTSQTVAPRANRSASSAQTPSVQRAEAPQPDPSQPETGDSSRSITPVGYHIEGLPENRGQAPSGHISHTKTGDTIMRGKVDAGKLGGKTVPEGMSMELPSKTTTDSVPSSATAPSSGSSLTGGSKMAGKAGGGYLAGKTDFSSVPPPSFDTVMSETQTVSETSPDSSSDAESESAPGGQNDVDKLARDVYNLLRDRLRVEQERRSKR
jgi:hypothetical protein